MSGSVKKYGEHKKMTLGRVVGLFLVMSVTILGLWAFTGLLMDIFKVGG